MRRRTPFLAAVARIRAEVDTVGSLGRLAAAAASVQNWANATEGRRRTRRVLRPLARAGWRVHEVETSGGGSFDHVLLGPCGVYVLASRVWAGIVTVDHKGATVTPMDYPGGAWTARGQHRELPPAAAAVVRALATATGRPIPSPRAVVVVWAPFPENVTVSGGITYVSGEYLAEWLAGQPDQPGAQHLAALTPVDVAAGLPGPRSAAVPAPRLAPS